MGSLFQKGQIVSASLAWTAGQQQISNVSTLVWTWSFPGCRRKHERLLEPRLWVMLVPTSIRTHKPLISRGNHLPVPSLPSLAGGPSQAVSAETNKGLSNCLTSCLSGTPSSSAITRRRTLEDPGGLWSVPWRKLCQAYTRPGIRVSRPPLWVCINRPKHQRAYAGIMRNCVVPVSEQHNNSTVIWW